MNNTPVRRLPLALGIAATVVVLDQLTKLWAVHTLTGRDPIPVVGTFLQLQLSYNPGAAFSMGTGATWIFTIAAAAAGAFLLWYVTRPQPKPKLVGLSLMLGGAITHLADRLFRPPGFARGHVVDFINYNNWFIGNIADIALVGGAAWLILTSLKTPPQNQPG
jgi:signal peptidase II